MKMQIKKILSLVIAFTLVLTPMIIKAEKVEKEAELNSRVYEVLRVNKKDDSLSLNLVNEGSKEKEGLGDLVVHVSEDVLILDSKTQKIVDKDVIKVGDKLEVITRKNTPVTLSLPGQLTPAAIVIKTDDILVKADKFNKDFLSYDENLKLNIGKETEIVNYKGEIVKKEDIVDKDLVVLYGPTTFSIPAQTVGNIKIIELKEQPVIETEIKNLEKVIVNGKEITLTNKIYTEDEKYMLPLRQITEELGYEIKWNNKDRSVELLKGPLWHLVKIGDNNYNFAKMIVKLDKAPTLKDAHTFVPAEFLTEGLKVEVSIIDGILNITNK